MNVSEKSLPDNSHSMPERLAVPEAGKERARDLCTEEDPESTKVSQPSNASRKPWAIARLSAMFLLGLGLIAWLLWRVPLNEVGQSLANVHYPLLVLGIAGQLLTPYLRAERFRSMYDIAGRRIELTGLMGQYVLLNMLLPMRTGDIALLGILKMRKAIASIAEALPRWIVIRFGDLAAVLVLMLLTALMVPFHASLTPWVRAAQISLGLLVLGGFAGILVLRALPESEERPPSGFIPGRMWALRKGLTGLQNLRTLGIVFFFSLLIWIWQSITLTIQYAAFDLQVTPSQLWAISVILLAVSILPVHAPLGIGTYHAVQVGLLQLFEIPLPLALAAAIGIHAAKILAALTQGFLGMFMVSKQGALQT